MANQPNQRPLFFEGQYLGAEDLTAAVAYAHTQQARHALGAHTWGIAAGLELTEKDSPAGGGQVDVYIQPGYALDGFGRPIVVLAPYKIPAELFKDLVYDSTRDGGTPEGHLVDVWLRYDEAGARPPRPGFANCDTATAFSRVQETFRVEIGSRTTHRQQHDPITVAGHSIDAQDVLQQFDPKSSPLFDESVPYQAFPEEGASPVHWLIPLGQVRWKPNPVATQPGNFVKRSDNNPDDPNKPDDLEKSRSLRRYIGVVAESVQAAGGVIRLRDRFKDYSTITSSELVWVEGDLRVEGDARLFGSKLDFRDSQGLDNDIPLKIQRTDKTEVIGNQTVKSGSLQVVIGKGTQGLNSFSIGPLDASNPPQVLPKLTVLDNGKVGIGTATPKLTLDIQGDFGRDDGAATLHLLGSRIGDVDGKVLFVRAAAGGVVAFDGGNNVGIGTRTPVSTLQIAGDVALEKRDSATAAPTLPAGATRCWNDGTWLRLNQNLDFSKPIFGVHTPGLFAPGSLNVGGAGGWSDPGLGNVWVTGNIGIGTTTPGAKLQVVGGAIIPAVGNNPTAGIQFPSDPGGGGGDEAFIRYFVQAGETTKLLIGCQNDFDDTIGFFQFGQERMTLYNGNVGIGTTTPSLKLDIQGDFGRSNGPATLNLFGSTIGDTGNGVLSLRSGGGVVAFDGSDNVGIGTTTPSLKLDIQGDFGRSNGPATLNLFGSTIGDIGGGVLFLRSGGGVVAFDGSDNVLINTTDNGSGARLVVNGNAVKPGGGSWGNFSDINLKCNVQPLKGVLEKLLRLRGVSFEWKEPEKMGNLTGPQMGLVAQEVEPIFPEWVSTSPSGLKILTVYGFEALTVEALRELKAENDRLKKRLQTLEQRLKEKP